MQLYQQNSGLITPTPGLTLLPKLKYEHVHLSNFSKMRVDLAAQVSLSTKIICVKRLLNRC